MSANLLGLLTLACITFSSPAQSPTHLKCSYLSTSTKIALMMVTFFCPSEYKQSVGKTFQPRATIRASNWPLLMATPKNIAGKTLAPSTPSDEQDFLPSPNQTAKIPPG